MHCTATGEIVEIVGMSVLQPSPFPRSLLQTQRHDGFASNWPWGGHCDTIARRCVVRSISVPLPGQVDGQSAPFQLKLELYLPGLSRGSTGPRHFPNREVVFRLTCSVFWLAPQNRLYGGSVVGFRGFTFYFRPPLNFLAKASDSLPGFGSLPPA